MKWTENDIKNTGLRNNLHDKAKKNTQFGNKIAKIGKISVEKETIKKVLWVFHMEKRIPRYVDEHEFHESRKFKFDWAIPKWKLAIEYEGLMSKKSGHTTISGYTKDCEKYNLAQIEGWMVLRYTAKNYNEFANDLRSFIKKRNI